MLRRQLYKAMFLSNQREENEMTNSEKYVNAFVESLNVSAEKVPGLVYQSVQEWDSIGHMELITAVENAFDIMMETDDIIEFNSFEKGKEILTQKYGIKF